VHLCSCKSYQHLKETEITDAYMLYQYQKGINYTGQYELYDKSIINWDKQNIQIKKALADHVNNFKNLERRSVADIQFMILNKKPITYRPIKVIAPKEFGYLKMRDGSVVFYGIMGDSFIDLSSNKIYD